MSDSRAVRTRDQQDLPIAIIGAGFAGIGTAIQLKKAGFENFVILEKNSGVGGTWYHNRYPGCACDIPSFLYSFSFETKRDWSRPYAPQPEILEYLQGDGREKCMFGTNYPCLDFAEALAQIDELGLDDETKALLLTKNLRQLYRLA